ncbi:MAG: aminotransferase class V-fold PLP-dependent enzyme, partial [Bdellovibrionota bacterium]
MKHILLNPGPVNVSERVRSALLRGDACHREPEIAGLVASCRNLLLKLFDPTNEFDAVFFTGSGTAAVEAAIASTPHAGSQMLVVDNGVYGDRIAQIAQVHDIEIHRLKRHWDEWPDVKEIDRILSLDKAIDTVALVHHETTTGLLNPVREVGEVVRRHGRKFVLDAVSSLGGEELDLAGWGVDVAASTANKCVCGIPGISFVLVRKTTLDDIRRSPKRSLYLNIPFNRDAQERECGAFTPAIQVLWALEEALKEFLEETVRGRITRYKKASGLIRRRAAEMGLGLYLKDEGRLSNTITSFHLPEGKNYAHLHDELKRRGFIIYAGQGPLAGKIFRVANMGQVAESDYVRFLDELGGLLA